MYCKWKSKDILLSLKQCLLNVKIVYMNVNIWISVDKSKYFCIKKFVKVLHIFILKLVKKTFLTKLKFFWSSFQLNNKTFYKTTYYNKKQHTLTASGLSHK